MALRSTSKRDQSDGAAQGAALDALVGEIRACRICRDHPTGKALPHQPRPVLVASATARIAICGQAPGTRVHASGRPFTDPSGDRLRDWMGVTADEFYDQSRIAIVPMSFCFPGLDASRSDLPPRRECAATWHRRLFETMPQLELIILVGGYAQAWHLGPKRHATMTATVRNWQNYFARNEPVRRFYLPLPHPSWRNSGWLKANPWFADEVLPVMRREVRDRL